MRTLLAGLAAPVVTAAIRLAHDTRDDVKVRELYARIRTRSLAIDRALLAPDDPSKAARHLDENIRNLADLLKSIEDRQSLVIADMDALLKLAKDQQGRGGS